MKNQNATLCSLLLSLAMVSAGCGGSGAGNNPPPPPHALTFVQAATLSVGATHPHGVAVADFNGDGKPDIAVALSDSNSIAVFLNQGSGTFGAPVMTALQIPNGLGGLAAGDFNEDGKMDLVVSTISGGSQDNIILLGNGDGTFRQQAGLPNSCGSVTTVIADLNGDTHKDLVFGCNGGLQVFLGHGDGTFSPGVSLPLISAPGLFLGVAVDDFNGDGKLDIAAVDAGSQQFSSGSLDFYAGNGDGTFRNPTKDPLALTFPVGLAAGDFNKDGKSDVLIAYPTVALIGIGNGDGTFQTDPLKSVAVYSGGAPDIHNAIAVIATELQGSGVDVVTADYDAGIVQITLNKALGSAPPADGVFRFTLNPGTASIAVGDLNGDGVLDVVVSNYKTGEVSILLSSK